MPAKLSALTDPSSGARRGACSHITARTTFSLASSPCCSTFHSSASIRSVSHGGFFNVTGLPACCGGARIELSGAGKHPLTETQTLSFRAQLMAALCLPLGRGSPSLPVSGRVHGAQRRCEGSRKWPYAYPRIAFAGLRRVSKPSVFRLTGTSLPCCWVVVAFCNIRSCWALQSGFYNLFSSRFPLLSLDARRRSLFSRFSIGRGGSASQSLPLVMASASPRAHRTRARF